MPVPRTLVVVLPWGWAGWVTTVEEWESRRTAQDRIEVVVFRW